MGSIPLPACAPEAHLSLPRTLRVSVTGRCNFRCRYCAPAARGGRAANERLASLDDLAGAALWLIREAGVRRVKVTGGEPLLRRGLEEFVARIAAVAVEVSLTTNGALLASRARALAAAGLARVNVSLDSVDEERFGRLSGGGRLADTLAGIDAALEAGLRPVKLNAVLHRTGWHCYVPGLLDFAAGRGLELRFIELLRSGGDPRWEAAEFLAAGEVETWLEAQSGLAALPVSAPVPGGGAASAPARLTRVTWRGRELTLGWITPRSHPFCAACDRLRLDARGELRRCLMDAQTLPLAALLRAGGPDGARRQFTEYLSGKRAPPAMDAPLPMTTIGG